MTADDAVPALRALFDCSKSFGLTDAEAWGTVDRCLVEAGEEAMLGEYLDRLTDALAREILAKQRGGPRRSPVSDELGGARS